MPAPETIVLERVAAAADAALVPRDLPECAFDKLLRAAGKDGARVAVYQEEAAPNARNRLVLEVPVVLQVYLAFEAEPDENLVVDPRVIAEHAQAFREALRGPAGQATDPSPWFLKLQAVRYPDDPTGNKSRFEALIVGVGENEIERP